MTEAIIEALEKANAESQYQPLSTAMVVEFGKTMGLHLRDFLAQAFTLKDEIESQQLWVQITGEMPCKCNQLRSCDLCRPLCDCDEGCMCKACRAKPEPTRAELEAEFGRLPSRRSLMERLPEIKACDRCKIVTKDSHHDVQVCVRHRIKFMAENDNPVDQESCEHEFDPDEGFMCLNCGKEGAEEVLSAMADEAKDRRKYGDT